MSEEEFVKLHYVGKGLYDIERFKKEAHRYGVSRALPLSIVKKLKDHERIYLAQWNKGKALIFGYFTVDGLQYFGSEELKKKIREDERLKVRSESYSGEVVIRGCGCYTISSVTYVDNSISELAQIIDDARKELGENVKVFVTGRFYEIEPFEIPAPFSRGIVKVPAELILEKEFDVKLDPARIKILKKELAKLEGYHQVKRMTKKHKAVLNSIPLTAFN